jgi:hypothetical protein
MKIAVWAPNLIKLSYSIGVGQQADGSNARLRRLGTRIYQAIDQRADIFVAPEWYFAERPQLWANYAEMPEKFPNVSFACNSLHLSKLWVVMENLTKIVPGILIVAGTMIVRSVNAVSNGCVFAYGGEVFIHFKKDINTGEEEIMNAPEPGHFWAKKGKSYYATVRGPGPYGSLIAICKDKNGTPELGSPELQEIDFLLLPSYKLGEHTPLQQHISVICDGNDGATILVPEVRGFNAIKKHHSGFDITDIQEEHIMAIRKLRTEKKSPRPQRKESPQPQRKEWAPRWRKEGRAIKDDDIFVKSENDDEDI